MIVSSNTDITLKAMICSLIFFKFTWFTGFYNFPINKLILLVVSTYVRVKLTPGFLRKTLRKLISNIEPLSMDPEPYHIPDLMWMIAQIKYVPTNIEIITQRLKGPINNDSITVWAYCYLWLTIIESEHAVVSKMRIDIIFYLTYIFCFYYMILICINLLKYNLFFHHLRWYN